MSFPDIGFETYPKLSAEEECGLQMPGPKDRRVGALPERLAGFLGPLEPYVLDVARVGSRATCDPPVMDTDEDFLVLVKDAIAFASFVRFGMPGYKDSGEEYAGDDADEFQFTSITKTDSPINLIVTDDEDFYDKFLTASYVAKKLNILNGKHREILFSAILYGTDDFYHLCHESYLKETPLV